MGCQEGMAFPVHARVDGMSQEFVRAIRIYSRACAG